MVLSNLVEHLGIDRAFNILDQAFKRKASRSALGRRQAARDQGGCAALGRENVPRKVLPEIAPPPAVHSVTHHISPVLVLPDPSGHVNAFTYGDLLEGIRRSTDPHPLHVFSPVDLHHQLADVSRHHLPGKAHTLIQEQVKPRAQQPGWRDTRRVRRTGLDGPVRPG